MIPLNNVISITGEGQRPIYVVKDKIISFGCTDTEDGKPAFYMYTATARQGWVSPTLQSVPGQFSQAEVPTNAMYEPDIFIVCKTEREAHRLLERVLRALENLPKSNYYPKNKGENNDE